MRTNTHGPGDGVATNRVPRVRVVINTRTATAWSRNDFPEFQFETRWTSRTGVCVCKCIKHLCDSAAQYDQLDILYLSDQLVRVLWIARNRSKLMKKRSRYLNNAFEICA